MGPSSRSLFFSAPSRTPVETSAPDDWYFPATLDARKLLRSLIPPEFTMRRIRPLAEKITPLGSRKEKASCSGDREVVAKSATVNPCFKRKNGEPILTMNSCKKHLITLLRRVLHYALRGGCSGG